MPFRWRFGVKTNRHMGWLLFVQQVDQGIGKSKLRIGILSLTGNAGVSDQRIIGSKNEGKCV
jgi:hypothetical protein